MLTFFPSGREVPAKRGLRPWAGGTHTSRTIMLEEVSQLLAIEPQPGSRSEYAEAIVASNVLGKGTAATRRLTNTRLGELYALDPSVPLFRILRRLWTLDVSARPLLAMTAVLARDPLLLATAPVVLAMADDEEMSRKALRDAVLEVAGDRLNPSIADKVIRNAASSWTQSGHLEGRTFKVRRRVIATPVSVAFGLWVACNAGFTDTEAFSSGWMAALDCDRAKALDLAGEARRLGLIRMSVAESVVSLDFAGLLGREMR
jgi:hypothetical protein